MTTPFDPNAWYPSFADIEEYAAEVEYEGHHVEFNWAHNEIVGGFLDYVRRGVAAFAIKRYKLYKQAEEKIKDFRTYCDRMLGRSIWMINRDIEAARLALALKSLGFEQLPHCEAQARPLTKLLPPIALGFIPDIDHDHELAQTWQRIIDTIPAHRINASAIAAIVDGEPPNSKKQIQIPVEIYSDLAEKASLSGMSPQELLKKLVQEYQPDVPKDAPEDEDDLDDGGDAPEEPDEIKPITRQQMEVWVADMQNLLIETFGYAGESRVNNSG